MPFIGTVYTGVTVGTAGLITVLSVQKRPYYIHRRFTLRYSRAQRVAQPLGTAVDFSDLLGLIKAQNRLMREKSNGYPLKTSSRKSFFTENFSQNSRSRKALY